MTMAAKIFLFSLLMIHLLVSIPALADQTVVATGEAFLAHITPEEGQRQALQKARAQAVEQVCGVRLQAEAFVHNNTLQDDFIHSVSYGQVVSEEILKWEAEVIQDSPKTPPAFAYRVNIKAAVAKINDDPDPFFKVNLKLNKSVFHSGDEMIATISATKPCYINVLNFSADGSVILLFPNHLRKDNHIETDRKYEIPTPADRKGVLKLQVSTLPGDAENVEHIKVLATHEPLHLLEGFDARGQYSVMETTRFAAVEVARLVASIPMKSRAETTVAYKVVSVVKQP